MPVRPLTSKIRKPQRLICTNMGFKEEGFGAFEALLGISVAESIWQ